MGRKIISLNIDKKVYSAYLKICKEEGLVMSRKVEKFMDKFVRDYKK